MSDDSHYSTALPSFLRALDNTTTRIPYAAVFHHNRSPAQGPADALWWPCTTEHSPSTLLLFIPGNPGLLGFYIAFLSAIHEKLGGAIAIFAHAHLGHTPEITGPSVPRSASQLVAQVEGVKEILDAVVGTYGTKPNIILVGHSVGSWIVLQVLKARPTSISGVFLLFPTICDIAETPNGRRLSWLFRHPLPRIIAWASVLTRLLPMFVLARLFPDWPIEQLLVLRSLLHSPPAVLATLTMAHDEMSSIRALDIDLLNEHKAVIWIYFAEEDDWVGSQRAVILCSFDGGPNSVRIIHGHQDIPHAFCINHGEQLAEQCAEWLKSEEFRV